MDKTEVGEAIATARGCSNRNEYGVRIGDRAGKFCRELQPAGAAIGGDHVAQARHRSAFRRASRRRSRLVLVDANHFVAEVGK